MPVSAYGWDDVGFDSPFALLLVSVLLVNPL
jgi:hypothetical protein